MSFEGNPATEADGDLKRSLKMIPRWWSVVVVVAAVALFGLGFAIGDRSGDGEGSAPAIDIARELGYALPLDQRPAFADGEITQEEVEVAGERLTTCVESEGVAGWHFHHGRGGLQLLLPVERRRLGRRTVSYTAFQSHL